VPLAVGESGDQALVSQLIREHDVDAIIHFVASLIVPDSVRDPLGYYRNNTVNSRALIACAIETGVRHFIFSSTAAVYGNPATIPVDEETPTLPISPYGWSKLMTEIMLRDATRAHDLRHVTLRYFNVAGADPQGRVGQSSEAATHLIKVAAEAALGLRPKLEVFGTDYPTSDGTCIRDYIHVSDLVGAHLGIALPALRRPVLDGELRLRPRLFGPRSGRRGQTCLGRRFQGRARGAAQGRPRLYRRSQRARVHRSRLAAAL
jgi:UDP-glucose 4-epimerase